MNGIEWLMVATGLVGAVFFAIGIACWCEGLVYRWRQRREMRRDLRAARWDGK
jgi:hypothetical protein